MRPLLGEERESGEEIRHINISPEKNMELTKFADKANKCIACGSKTSTYDFEFVWIQKNKDRKQSKARLCLARHTPWRATLASRRTLLRAGSYRGRSVRSSISRSSHWNMIGSISY